MRIQISNRQLQLLQEALKDDIPQYMQDIVQKRYGQKYLDMDVPEHTQLIPELTKEVDDESIRLEIINKINVHFNEKIKQQWQTTFLQKLLSASYNAEETTFEARRMATWSADKLKGGKLFHKLILGALSDFQHPFLKENFYSKGFKLLISKNNNEENPIYSEKNKSNLYSFLVSMKRAFPQYFSELNPSDITNESTFVGLRNPIVNHKEIYDNLKKSNIFLHISSNPYDILRMSVSEFYDSCQNIYSGGDSGTEWNKKLLSNVFDKNSKVAYLIYNAPFTDKNGNKHPNSPVARMIIRTNNKGAILFDEVYPREMKDRMYQIVTDMTGLQNTGKPGDLYHYTNVEGLPEPYMDKYRAASSGKSAGENERASALATHFNFDINNITAYGISFFGVDGTYIDNIGEPGEVFFDVYTPNEIDEKLNDVINDPSFLSVNVNYVINILDWNIKSAFIERKIIPFKELLRIYEDEFISKASLEVVMKTHPRAARDNAVIDLAIQNGISTFRDLNKLNRRKFDLLWEQKNNEAIIKALYENKLKACNALLIDRRGHTFYQEINANGRTWYIQWLFAEAHYRAHGYTLD